MTALGLVNMELTVGGNSEEFVRLLRTGIVCGYGLAYFFSSSAGSPLAIYGLRASLTLTL